MSLREWFERGASGTFERVVDGYESHDGGCHLIVRGRVLMRAKSIEEAAADNGLAPEALRVYMGASRQHREGEVEESGRTEKP